MAGENLSSRSSSSKTATSAIPDDKTLLKFYQRKFEEYQRTEDRYKEKVDRHLKNLVTDRHELEEEVLKRGEKISDLQKALVELQLSVFEERERFLKVSAENEELKRNEEQLHANIRQLLAMTHQQDLRDKIIYILKDPKVQIGYRADLPTKSKSANIDFSASKKLKEELEYLQNQLDEVLKISRSKSDIVLEDCKQALEKSKEKIQQDEIQIRELQNRLQNLNAQKSSSLKSLPSESELLTSAASVESLSNICSSLKDIHLSLILLLKIVSKISNILISMQATKLYQRIANIPNPPTNMQHIVEENSIVQLETFLRQCTRLTFDINNMHKSLSKYVSNNKKRIENINALRSELNHLEDMLKEMTILTAENDLLNVGLGRSSFYYALRDSSVAIGAEDRKQHLIDFKKIISNSEILHETVSKASDFVESVAQKYNAKKYQLANAAESSKKLSATSIASQRGTSRRKMLTKSDSELISVKKAKSDSVKDLERLLGIYKNIVQEAQNLGLGQATETALLSEKLKEIQKKLDEENLGIPEDYFKEDVTKRLEKDRLEISEDNFREDVTKKRERNRLEMPEDNFREDVTKKREKDRLEMPEDNFREDVTKPESVTKLITSNSEEILRNINKTLSKVKKVERGEYLKDEQLCQKLAENVKDLSKKFKELSDDFSVKSFQDQFSEYSRVTLSKLEELANQSRNSVIAAEAQIAAHRSNAKNLSQKLKETEDLLRESINECLSLKQKLKLVEEQHEMNKYTLISGLKEKLSSVTGFNEVDRVLNELDVYITDNQGTKADPFVCNYCQQGMGHKLCREQIEDLRKEERKSRTELKLLMKETKEEKRKFIDYQNISEKAVADLNSSNETLKKAIKTLESNNVSLLERLKVEKGRIKNMERYRRLEIEGFQTDIKNLKTKIRELEKQLLKAVLIFENNHKDLELLKTVHETAQRSKQATAALKRLKAKLYELENDIKSL